jgi:hypothetical protein
MRAIGEAVRRENRRSLVVPKDRISKNLFDEGWTIRHHDGTKSRITKDFSGEGYTIRHESGAKATATKDFMSDDWTIHLPGGGKAKIGKGFLSDNWTVRGGDISAEASKDFLSDDWTIRHAQSQNILNPSAPARARPPVPGLEPMKIDVPGQLGIGRPIDPALTSFGGAASDDGSDCLYVSDVWRIRSAIDPMQTVSTRLAITTSRVCWEGVVLHEQRGLFRSKKEELRVFRSLGIANIEGAEIAKDAWWPQHPSYMLLLHGSAGASFFVQHQEAVSFLREVVGVLRAIGIDTHDRHDIFWAGGGDPYYRPPLDE